MKVLYPASGLCLASGLSIPTFGLRLASDSHAPPGRWA